MYTGNKSFNLRRKPLPRSFFKKATAEVEEVKVEEPKPVVSAQPKKKQEKKPEEEQQ